MVKNDFSSRAAQLLPAGLLAACLAVCFLYGSLVWGLLPVPEGVSWETHLAAALIGVATAIASRRLDVLPRKHYTWEGENDENDEGSLRP